MNDHRPNDATAALDEQLVAYLDGELDVETSREIEARLASDPQARRRLQSLERTWDLLDELDAPPVGEPFTRSTLEMVALAAREGVERDRAAAPQRFRRRTLFVSAGLAAAAVAGFLAVVFLAPNQNRQLLQDLPILENFDEYRQVESVEFLRELRKRGLFAATEEDAPSRVVPTIPDDAAARRRFIENLTLDDRQQLLQVENRFLALEPEEQQRLRRLDDELRRDGDAAQLDALMRRYCDWLRTLSSYSRAELAEMQIADRVAAVEKRVHDEMRLPRKDVQVLSAWLQERMRQQERQLLASLPESERHRIDSMKEPRRSITLLQMWQRTAHKPLAMTDEDMARLRSQLSLDTRTRLESLSASDQRRQVATWLHKLFRNSRYERGSPPKAIDQRLMEFFEKGLSDQERDRLLGMTPDAMHRELQRMFNARPSPPERHRPRPMDR